MDAYYFGRDKTAVLGAIKAQLNFQKANISCYDSRNIIPFPTIFYHLNFHLPHPSRSNNVSPHKCPFQKAIKQYKKEENCIPSLYPIISRWVPLRNELGFLKQNSIQVV